MKKRLSAVAAAVVLCSVSAPAYAQQDIPWSWNSNDHDAKAMFQASGEHILAYEYRNTSYVDWTHPDTGQSRWWIPGDGDGKKKDNNLDLAEGKIFKQNVCQYHTAYPDDCSGWKSGVS